MIIATDDIYAQDPVTIFVDGNELLSFDPATCSLRFINQFPQSFTDIALHPNGNLYGVRTNGSIYELVEETGSVTFVHQMNRNANTIYTALASSVNGNLYVGELDGDIDTYNPDTDIENYLGAIGFNIEGDLSFRDGALLAGSTNGIVAVDQDFLPNSSLIPWFTSEPLWGLYTDYIDCDNQQSYAMTGITRPSTIYLVDHLNETSSVVCEIDELVFGCTGSDELQASSIIDIELEVTQPVCGQTASLEIILNQDTNLTFSLNGSDFSDQLFYTNVLVGPNTLIAIDQFGCDEEFSFTIEAPDDFDVSVESTDATCDSFGQLIITITSGNNLTFTIDGETFTDPIIEIQTIGENIVTVSDDQGCSTDFTFTINDLCEAVTDPPQITVPTAFSPNLNEFNEVFRILSPEDTEVTVLNYQIFDRWGNKLFENNNFTNQSIIDHWDGRFDNGELFEGIFLYHITYEYSLIRDEIIDGAFSGTAVVLR